MWYYAVHPGNSFFFSFKNKKNIYIYIFIFSCRVAPEQVCMATICGFPQPQAEDQACPPTPRAGAQRDSEGQSQGGQASAFPLWEAPGRRVGGAWLRAAALGWEPAPGSPALFQRPLTPSLWGQKPQGRGHWELPRTQAFGEPEKRTLTVVSPCSRPLAPGGTAVLQESPQICHLLALTRVWCAMGLQGGPAGSSALANYCDVSAPLRRSPFWKGSPGHPSPLSSDPNLEPAPPPLF